MATWTEALGGLFKGTPQTAPSYTTTTSDVPKWLQDYTVDLFSQQRAVSSLPFLQYQLPRNAQEAAETAQARNVVQQNLGSFNQPVNEAIQGTQGISRNNAGLNTGMGMLQQAGGMNAVDAFSPFANQAAALNPSNAANSFLSRSSTLDSVRAANPYLAEATSQNIAQAQNPYLASASQAANRALSTDSLAAANPYLAAASRSSASTVNDYMNPYNQAVTDQIAKLGARNLSENLLPNVSDQFIRAGQFGSSRMGEFGSRALRDTQESILDNQSRALQAGFGQALTAGQTDAARQATLAGTAGNLAGQNASQALQGSTAFGNLAQTAGSAANQQAQNALNAGQIAGNLTGQQASNLTNLGQTAGNLTTAQQQLLANLGQSAGNLTSQQQQNQANIGAQFGNLALQGGQQQLSALNQAAELARLRQGLNTSDAAALQAIGGERQALQQRGFDIAYQDFLDQRNFPQQQVNAMSTTLRGLPPAAIPTGASQVGATTQFAPSPLSQIASGYFATQGFGATR